MNENPYRLPYMMLVKQIVVYWSNINHHQNPQYVKPVYFEKEIQLIIEITLSNVNRLSYHELSIGSRSNRRDSVLGFNLYLKKGIVKQQ